MSTAAPARQASFANRLLVWFLFLIVVIAGASLLALRTSLLFIEAERLESLLQQEVEELRTLAGGSDPETGEPFGLHLQRIFQVFLERNIPSEHETVLTLIDGRPDQRSRATPPLRLDLDQAALQQFAAATAPTRSHLQTTEGRVDYIAVPIRGEHDARPAVGTFVIAYFTDLAQAQTDRALLTVTLVVAGVAVLLAGAAAVWLSRQLTRPLTAMAETAAALDGRDLSQRVPIPRDRELGTLAVTINGMIARIESLLVAQKRFLADAGHELRTPITIVSGHLDMLEDDPEEREETLELVQDELSRMGRMVGDLSTLAKAEQPDFLTMGEVEVHRLAERLEHVVSQIDDRRWSVEVRGTHADQSITADEDRLVQAVVALADNAARHTDDGQPIRITVSGDADALRLSVSDQGPGIPPDVQDTLFERFVRHGSRRGGAGLGLSIVRSIAEGHDGQVAVRSEPGDGATFTLAIPRQPPVEGP